MALSRVRRALARAFVFAVSEPAMSRIVGWLADVRWPGPLLRAAIRLYVRAYRVDLAEAKEPIQAYPTFNAFFTRALREGARPLAEEPGAVLSPADSIVNSIGPVPADGQLEQIKGRDYDLASLLGAPEDALPYRHGLHATLYLSPSMYHRVHSPVSGRIVAWRYVPGRLFPVNALAVRHVHRLFSRNERVAVHIESDEAGRVAVVLVGATNVGRITLRFAELTTNRGRPAAFSRLPMPIPVQRGDELGAFNLGSTVVLLTEARDLTAAAAPGDVVHVRNVLWRRN